MLNFNAVKCFVWSVGNEHGTLSGNLNTLDSGEIVVKIGLGVFNLKSVKKIFCNVNGVPCIVV